MRTGSVIECSCVLREVIADGLFWYMWYLKIFHRSFTSTQGLTKDVIWGVGVQSRAYGAPAKSAVRRGIWTLQGARQRASRRRRFRSHYHNKAETKWPPLCRRHFDIYFLNENYYYILIEISPKFFLLVHLSNPWYVIGDYTKSLPGPMSDIFSLRYWSE